MKRENEGNAEVGIISNERREEIVGALISEFEFCVQALLFVYYTHRIASFMFLLVCYFLHVTSRLLHVAFCLLCLSEENTRAA